MNTDALLYEVQNQEKELIRLKAAVKKCSGRIKTLMNNVIENMRENGETEHSYNGKKYYIEEKTSRSRKGERKKKTDALQVLNENGLEGPDAEDIYVKIVDAFQGPETRKVILKKDN